MHVLFPFLPFDTLETPVSFASRLALRHTGERLVPFLHDMRIKPLEFAGGSIPAIKRLCDVAGVDSAVVLNNTAQRVGKRRFNLRGNEITAEFLASPDTVFCPACLLEDDLKAGGDPRARRGRLMWTLRPVRTCPHHGLALVRRRKKRWDDQFHEMAVRVPERGRALEDLAGAAKCRSVSPLQTYVAARLEGGSGPDWLDSQSLEQAVRTTEILGVVLEFGADRNLNELTLCDWDLAGRTGYAFTSAGETGIREALHQMQSAFNSKGGKPGRRKVFGALYEWLAHSDSNKDPGDITRIMRRHIFETMELAPGELILGEALEHRRLHSVQSLARESALDPRTLRNLLAARGLVPNEAAVSGYHVFDAQVGREVADSIGRSIHVISLPKALNCTRPQADQLLDERLIMPISDGSADTPGRTQKAVDAESVTAFLASLRSIARLVDEIPSGMVPISKAAEKAKAPSIEVVHLILGGCLENVVRLADIEGYAAVLVDPAEVRAEIAKHMLGISPSKAFAAIKVPKHTGWALVHRARDPILGAIAVDTPNGRHRLYRFDEGHVAEFGRRFTTEVRIANELGVRHQEIGRRLRAGGVRPILGRSEIGLDLYRIADLPASCAA